MAIFERAKILKVKSLRQNYEIELEKFCEVKKHFRAVSVRGKRYVVTRGSKIFESQLLKVRQKKHNVRQKNALQLLLVRISVWVNLSPIGIGE